jgi:hypothetical protein
MDGKTRATLWIAGLVLGPDNFLNCTLDPACQFRCASTAGVIALIAVALVNGDVQHPDNTRDIHTTKRHDPSAGRAPGKCRL